MFLPYNVDVPMRRVPFTNWALMAFTVIVSLAMFGRQEPKSLGDILAEDPEIEGMLEHLEEPGLSKAEKDKLVKEIQKRVGAKVDGPPWSLQPLRFSFWNLFSYLFVHADFWHLAGNMLFLFVFGNAVNAKLGHGLFLVSYLLLGALAGLGWLLLGNGAPLVGASGAIMGIVGIFLILFPHNDVSVFYWIGFAITGTTSFSSGWLILFYMVGDLVGCLFGGGGAVAYICHLTGAAGGIALAVGLVVSGVVRSSSYEKNLLQILGVQGATPKKKRKKRDRDEPGKSGKKGDSPPPSDPKNWG